MLNFISISKYCIGSYSWFKVKEFHICCRDHSRGFTCSSAISLYVTDFKLTYTATHCLGIIALCISPLMKKHVFYHHNGVVTASSNPDQGCPTHSQRDTVPQTSLPALLQHPCLLFSHKPECHSLKCWLHLKQTIPDPQIETVKVSPILSIKK